MSFVTDVAAEAGGGVVTAAILGTWALRFAVGQQIRQHDERIADLDEDNRRWFRDREAHMRRELAQLADDHAARGVSQSSIADGEQAACKRLALHEYRDEITTKRRLYRQLRAVEGWAHARIRRGLWGWRANPMRRFELTDDHRRTLNSWRTFTVLGDQPGTTRPIPDDPTSEEREPDLRRFEREGDPPR
jgi:hypothetical protein